MKVQTAATALAAAFLLITPTALAVDRLVPGEYPTIQAAIDAAVDGDTIIVAPGRYYENTDFGEKSITLTSANPSDPNTVAATILDANGSGRAVTFPETDTVNVECVLSGLTITGGNSAFGGAIRSDRGARTIVMTDCVITGNTAGDGGSLYNDDSNLVLLNCTFSQNSTTDRGGAIVSQDGELMLTACTFIDNSAGYDGGGIYIKEGELTLNNCALRGNSSGGDGGAMGCDYGSVTVTNCTLSGNSADSRGGGLYNSHASTNATNCIFRSNSAAHGGGVGTKHLYLGDLTLSNCTFYGNSADGYGGAVYNWDESNLMLTNCILWGNIAYNEGPQIAMEINGTVSVSYSCLQGYKWDIYTGGGAVLDWGDGNIDDDPCFADTSSGDFHLRSTAGRWDANTSIWVTDDSNSPCVDAGDPNSDWTAELWPHGKRVNMGVFGGTAEASMSESEVGNIADLDPNGSVNWVDLKLITERWLYQQLLLSEDLNRDGLVNGRDFAIFADNWAWNE